MQNYLGHQGPKHTGHYTRVAGHRFEGLWRWMKRVVALRPTLACHKGVAPMTVKAHRIVIDPTSIRCERGQYYRVYFQDAVLIEDCWNPEFEACRLVTRGVTGPPRGVAGRQAYPGLIFPGIEEGARWTVLENDKIGPIIVPYEPFPDHLRPHGISREGEIAPAAENSNGGERSTNQNGRLPKHRERSTGSAAEQ